MQNTYNFYNLEASFKQFLLSGIVQSRTEPESTGSGTGTRKQMTPVSIKNYLSDIRHFFGWLTFVIASEAKQSAKNEIASSSSTPRDDIGSFINVDTIEKYKSYLQENNIPFKTINRRLSTVRKFCSFCVSQGWMKDNPAKHLTNILSLPGAQTETLVKEYESYLKLQVRDQAVITSSLNTIQDLLQTI